MSRNYELLLAVEDDEIVAPPRPTLVEPRGVPPIAGRSPEQNALFKIVQCLFLIPDPAAAPRSVLFCPVGESSDSASFVLRLAMCLGASTPSSVCLVEANFHAPTLHRLPGRHTCGGLAEAMRTPSDARSFVEKDSPSGIWVLPAGTSVGVSPVLFADEHLGACLAELRSHFDRLLVIAPPLELSEDALWLGRLTDGVVLLLEAGATRRGRAMRAKASFEAVKATVLGAVLTGHKIPIPKALERFL